MTNSWDIDPAQDGKSVSSIFGDTGFVVLRQVVDRSAVLDLAARLGCEFDRLSSVGSKLPPDQQKNLNRSELPADPENAPFRLDVRNFQFLTSSSRLTSSLEAILKEPFFWHYPPMFRRSSPQNRKGLLPYHQDFVYNTHYPRLLTCFTPLSDCGVDAPGLELVGKSQSVKYEHSSDGAWEFGIPDKEILGKFSSSDIFRPELRAGDIVVFDELTLHRTYATDQMSRIRFSMDARAVPTSAISREIKARRKFVNSRTNQLESET